MKSSGFEDGIFYIFMSLWLSKGPEFKLISPDSKVEIERMIYDFCILLLLQGKEKSCYINMNQVMIGLFPGIQTSLTATASLYFIVRC